MKLIDLEGSGYQKGGMVIRVVRTSFRRWVASTAGTVTVCQFPRVSYSLLSLPQLISFIWIGK